MREAIRSRLLDEDLGVSELVGGVFEPGTTDPNTVKPYAVVKFAGETSGTVKNTFDRAVEVWVYVPPASYTVLDNINEKVIQSLTKKELVTEGGLVFLLELMSVAPDGFFDETLEARTKHITFNQAFVRG